MAKLRVGHKAPDFNAPDENGRIVSLSDFSGRKLVLYFYPKDSTPTCTEEACNLRDNYRMFLNQGYTILGVSADSGKRHQNFIRKFKLPFSLLSDTDLAICKAYGVWGEKMLFGRKYMGILRTTFVIDEKGKIAKIIDKVQSKAHTAQIL